MDYHALLDFFGAFNKGIENRTKAIDQADKALGKFTGVMTSGIQGQAAVGISNYINEVHKEGIETQLQALITRFNELVNIYVSDYTKVDEGGDAFYLSSNDYERLDANITRLTSKVIPYFSDFNKIVSSVSDICDLSSAKSKASSAHKSLTEDTNQLKKKIKNQREKWVRYESKQSKAFDELDDEISAIESLIDQYKSKSPNVMTEYQEGMFNAQMSGQTAQVLTNMYQNIDRDSKKAKVAQKNISHAIKDYQKFLEAKRKKAEEEANKRDGWSSLVVDAAFILGGAAVSLFSGGAAIPFVFSIGATIMDGSQIIEDINKGVTGKKEGSNLVKSFMMSLGMTHQQADVAFTVLSIGTATLSSEKAFKNLAEAGFLKTNPIKATPVFTNTKSLFQDTGVIKRNKSLFNETDLIGQSQKRISGNALKNSFITDMDGIKNNVASIRKVGWYREGFGLSFTGKKGTAKAIVKEYGKEAMKQTEKYSLKNLTDQEATTVVNSYYGKDKTSVNAKLSKRILSKLIGLPTKTRLDSNEE